MAGNPLSALEQGLDCLRIANDVLEDADAGICKLHLDACIAALENRIAVLKGEHPLTEVLPRS